MIRERDKPESYFLPFPDPGSRGQKGTGSRIRNTGCKLLRKLLMCWKVNIFTLNLQVNKNWILTIFLFNLDFLFCAILLYYFSGPHNGPYMLQLMFIGRTVKANFVSCCFASILSNCLLRLQNWRHSFQINSFRKRKSGRPAQASQWSQWQVRTSHFWFC